MEQVTITRHPHEGKGEYRAHVEGHSEIGRLTWIEQNGVRSAEQTLVPKEIGGRGVAGKLVEDMVADARANGFRIRPACSYVVAAFEKNPDWADVKA